MNALTKITLQVLLVVAATVLLCLLIPAFSLIEFFLVLLGTLFIVGCSLLITREVMALTDLWHHYKLLYQHREAKLQKLKRLNAPIDCRYRRTTKL